MTNEKYALMINFAAPEMEIWLTESEVNVLRDSNVSNENKSRLLTHAIKTGYMTIGANADVAIFFDDMDVHVKLEADYDENGSRE